MYFILIFIEYTCIILELRNLLVTYLPLGNTYYYVKIREVRVL